MVTITDFVKRSEYKYDENETNKENVGKLIYGDFTKSFDSIKHLNTELYPLYACFEFAYDKYDNNNVTLIIDVLKKYALDVILHNNCSIRGSKIRLIVGFHNDGDLSLCFSELTENNHLKKWITGFNHLITNCRSLLPKLD